MKLNINTKVKIKPTEEGFKILHKFYEWCFAKTITDYKNQADENGYITMQLYEVMQIFGQYFRIDRDTPIESTILIENI